VSDQLIFRGSRKKGIWLALGCLVFVAMAVPVGLSGDWVGWAGMAFFGLGVLVGSLQATLANRIILTLDQKGFEMDQTGRRHRTSWREVESFELGRMSRSKVIVVRYAPSYRRYRKTRAVIGWLTRLREGQAIEGSIPDQYTETPEAICAALNAWKQRYG
jgi:hypothetical protein